MGGKVCSCHDEEVKIFDEFEKWNSNRSPRWKPVLTVSGLVGAGKSTLVNSFTGKKTCSCGERADKSSGLCIMKKSS